VPNATGVLVSRRSPGTAEFNAVSQRSSRDTSSPIERANSVIAGGPPSTRSRALAALLSLCCTAAWHNSASVMG